MSISIIRVSEFTIVVHIETATYIQREPFVSMADAIKFLELTELNGHLS